MKKFLDLSISDVVFILLINVKMSTIVGIFTFMSKINFMLSCVEYEKSFITSGLVQHCHRQFEPLVSTYNKTSCSNLMTSVALVEKVG